MKIYFMTVSVTKSGQKTDLRHISNTPTALHHLKKYYFTESSKKFITTENCANNSLESDVVFYCHLANAGRHDINGPKET